MILQSQSGRESSREPTYVDCACIGRCRKVSGGERKLEALFSQCGYSHRFMTLLALDVEPAERVANTAASFAVDIEDVVQTEMIGHAKKLKSSTGPRLCSGPILRVCQAFVHREIPTPPEAGHRDCEDSSICPKVTTDFYSLSPGPTWRKPLVSMSRKTGKCCTKRK